MNITLTFTLVKAARGSGGDRYEAPLKDDRSFVIYVPQDFSRGSSGVPAKILDITLCDGK